MLVYLFSSNYSNPSTGGGISSDLCRSNSLGTSHSRHESESEWLAVSAKWLESVKSHSTGLETKSSCGLDCENSPSTGLVYKWKWKWGLGIVSLCELVYNRIHAFAWMYRCQYVWFVPLLLGREKIFCLQHSALIGLECKNLSNTALLFVRIWFGNFLRGLP